MLNRFMLRQGLFAAGCTAAALLLGVPAGAGEIYSWRTEDGAYAFTDDAKAIPARYRDQVETRANADLGGYARLTAPAPGSTDAYAKRLARRLEYLRALNRELDVAHAPATVASTQAISLDSGPLNIGLPVDDADGPVIIENVRFRYQGEEATRHNTVVRKGGKTVAVIKGQRNIGPINQGPGITHQVD